MPGASARSKAIRTRLQGLVLLALCALALRLIFRLVQTPPAHPPSMPELALGLIAVVNGMFGAACVLVGPALFRPYVWPPPDGD
jgi:hypothetical protein